MDKKELDNLRELHMEFSADAHRTQNMDSNSITDFFGWIYKQLGIRADAEMSGFNKGLKQAQDEKPTHQ